jgi:hypothetical protein
VLLKILSLTGCAHAVRREVLGERGQRRLLTDLAAKTSVTSSKMWDSVCEGTFLGYPTKSNPVPTAKYLRIN